MLIVYTYHNNTHPANKLTFCAIMFFVKLLFEIGCSISDDDDDDGDGIPDDEEDDDDNDEL